MTSWLASIDRDVAYSATASIAVVSIPPTPVSSGQTHPLPLPIARGVDRFASQQLGIALTVDAYVEEKISTFDLSAFVVTAPRGSATVHIAAEGRDAGDALAAALDAVLDAERAIATLDRGAPAYRTLDLLTLKPVEVAPTPEPDIRTPLALTAAGVVVAAVGIRLLAMSAVKTRAIAIPIH